MLTGPKLFTAACLCGPLLCASLLGLMSAGVLTCWIAAAMRIMRVYTVLLLSAAAAADPGRLLPWPLLLDWCCLSGDPFSMASCTPTYTHT
jgi:hypothetical protein